MLYLLYFRLITSRMFLHLSHIQGLYWFRRGLWSWGSHPQTPGLRTNREPKYKRRRTVRVSSLIAARQPWCTHTSRVWRRPCEKPCRISFAPVDVSWSYWICKPVGGRTAEGMLKQRLWWEMPQWIGFRTRVQFPPGPLFNKLANLQEMPETLEFTGVPAFLFFRSRSGLSRLRVRIRRLRQEPLFWIPDRFWGRRWCWHLRSRWVSGLFRSCLWSLWLLRSPGVIIQMCFCLLILWFLFSRPNAFIKHQETNAPHHGCPW